MTTDTEKPDGSSSELTAWNPLEALILPAVRSWGLIAITTVLGAIVGTFLALVKPNEYESHAKIHVRPSLASSANPELAMSDDGGGPTAKPDIANHFHLLTSEEVFLEVAQDLGPMTILQPYHPAGDDSDGTPFLTRKLHEFQSWWFGAYEFEAAKSDQAAYSGSGRMLRAAVEVLKGSTSVSTDGVSNIIDVHYRTHDPALAQTILASVIKKHEERHLLISSVKPVTDFFRKQQDKYQEEWEAATSELNAFRDQHQISDLSTQIADLFSEKERLERELNFEDNRMLAYREKKLAEFKEEFANTSEKVMTDERTERVPNPEYVLKYNELQDQRKELLRVLDTFTVGIEVEDQKAKVAALESQLLSLEPEREVAIPPQPVRNPDYEPLEERIEALEETIEENQLSIETKKSRLQEVTTRLGSLREQQTEFDSLRRRVERAEYLKSNFERASQQFSVTRMLQEQSESNLSVWTEPTIPFRKSGPQRAKLVIASLGGGVFAGFGLALVRSVMDRTVRRRKELETLLGVPCIGVVQATTKWPWRQARKASRKFPVEEVR